MIKRPQFSIIVPIFNVEAFLRKCIDSILNQSYKDFELILVDDGSQDNCAEICDEYKKADKRVNVLHKSNGGLVSARNAGVALATGNYIGYVDGDDWVSTDWLEIIQNIIVKYNADIISYNAYKSTDGNNLELKTSNFEGFFDRAELVQEIFPRMLYDCHYPFYTFGILPAVWAKIIRSDILKKNICTETKITFGEDVACTYNCLLDCNSFYGLEDHLYYYRQNRQAMTKAYDARRFDRISILFDYLEKTFVNKDKKALQKQYDSYKLFCIFYAVLNEGKSHKSINEIVKIYRSRLSEYNQFIQNFDGTRLSAPWKLFHYLIIQKSYRSIALMCKLIVKIKYTYKE